MIGVAEDDLGSAIFEILWIQGFDRSNCADWHIDRSLNHAVAGLENSCTGFAGFSDDFKF